MATLRYSQIRAHPGGTIHYIANEAKVVAEDGEDVIAVLNYMGEPESKERVYSFAQHCSQNPDLAEKQMALYREQYFAGKKGGIQGLKKGNDELLGLHFFLSYTEADSPSQRAMDNIAMRIARHPLLRDFAVFGADHFDKTHRHTHFYVCAYSCKGKPRKLAMKKKDFNELRKYANKLCVEHGLSIIDLSALRWKDPEYSEWIDGVIAEGKVVVHPEKEERKRLRKQKATTQQIYYKWKMEKEEREAEEERMIPAGQKFARDYFYALDGNEARLVSGEPKERIYIVPKRAPDGHMRTRIELIITYIHNLNSKERQYILDNDPALWVLYHARVDRKLQGMMDAIKVANDMHISDPDDIPDMITDVGKQMNALRKEKARHEQSIKKQGKIIAAYRLYSAVRDRVEGVQEPEQSSLDEYKKAYAILVQNQILTAQAYDDLCRRYNFEKQKIVDYDRRMPELNRQYHGLKRLEAITRGAAGIIDEIFEYSVRSELRQGITVDERIELSKMRAENAGEGIKGHEEREI